MDGCKYVCTHLCVYLLSQMSAHKTIVYACIDGQYVYVCVSTQTNVNLET